MARSFLGLTEQDFWNASPRKLTAMIREWKRIQRGMSGLPDEPTADTPGSTPGGDDATSAFWAAWDRGMI